MAKIIVAMNDELVREIKLSGERITLGRAPHNDVVLDHRAISAEHAVIVRVQGDAFLEDLNSTNGTQVNGQPIKKHFLQEGDVIELARYRIRYVEDDREEDARAGSDAKHSSARGGEGAALIRILDGANAGKEIAITKALTTVGRPDVQVAVITRRPNGYCLAHVEGASYPAVHGSSIGTTAHILANGDVISLVDFKMQFVLKERQR